ncbi:glycerophosphodiester phosphodiesterase family protein [Pedobacter sp. BS3]|uniref:glycerophosphodiester phosphodiesterase family protein n=1 Tax=Pedobacter sp. BS3 TaxID=2567937 RepID=UPI0018D8C501|nr:glycerophosphodiester phosphodiesterase family protein [Pedobacter sp. BS3]
MKTNGLIVSLLIGIHLAACAKHAQTLETDQKGEKAEAVPEFFYEAHRGGRGLLPENTIIAMKHAVDLNVTTLEMDLVISKDKKVVVSHNLYFSADFTTTPEGNAITAADGRSRLLYNMPYDSIRKYDVGLKQDPRFPNRKCVAAKIPLLADLITEVEAYAASKGKKMFYDMEIKSSEAGDNIKHPAPQEFVDLVMAVVRDKKITERTVIQSFDIRPLKLLKEHYPQIKLSCLVNKSNATDVDKRLQELGFNPDFYSADYTTITADMVKTCHDKGMKVIAWTVDTEQDINRLKALGVNSIITDYPNLFKLVDVSVPKGQKHNTKVIITGYISNPAGADANNEYVQLMATEHINFALTPYAVITAYSSSSGNYATSAPAKGWITGKVPSKTTEDDPTSQTTKFNLTKGEVQAGEFFYVGGANKKINGSASTNIDQARWIRTLNYQQKTTWSGDDDVGGGKFGALFSNGAMPQGIAVFNTTNVTEATVPVDVVFFGTFPTSEKDLKRLYDNLDGKALGYRICNTDRYSTTNGEFFGKGDNIYTFSPASNADASAQGKFYRLGGIYDLTTREWTKPREAIEIIMENTSPLSLIETGAGLTTLLTK